MPHFNFEGIKLVGLASCVPTEKVSVESFRDLYGEEAIEKFTSMTGIKSFHRTAPHQTASDLAFAAGEKLLTEKGVDRNEIGALVFVAHSTDYRRPATACVLHKRLGLSKDCAAFDVGLGCSAVAYGIQIVCSMMANSDMKRGLLIVGESLTKMVCPKDRAVNMMFGDGGAAFLFEKDESCSEGISVLLKSDGSGYRAIIAPAGGFRNLYAPTEEMLWPDGNVRSLYHTYMNGTDVFSFTISDVPTAIREFLEKTGTSVDEYDCFAFHQANQFILKQLCKRAKIPAEKMPLCLDRYGNTSAPATALALCDAYGTVSGGKVRTMFCCFGIGLSWGVARAVIDADCIYPVLETDEIFEEGIINEPF